MIASIPSTNSANIVPSTTDMNESAQPRWPSVKVLDRVALLERRDTSEPSSKSPCHLQYQPPQKQIIGGDGDTVRSFLESIGEADAMDTTTVPPTLWRCAAQWKKQMQQRVNQRSDDREYVSLSKEMDRIDALLYSNCTILEIHALNVVASSSTSSEGDAAFDYSDDSDDEDTDDDDGREESPIFASLENALEELTTELQHFD